MEVFIVIVVGLERGGGTTDGDNLTARKGTEKLARKKNETK